ncbi:hypothetical protein NQ315_015785 [Exocentrus adspersus]|uniref:Uncharacterized protein n=1 Tax=Exocentrus adspersus TaxID=1586481 RepID=A0AAV8W4K4_9CUCU|nr:hypothetical protein NQ315_015785 [Exocentrus adspersus]
MGDRIEFENVLPQLDKYQSEIKDYLLHKKEPDCVPEVEESKSKFAVYREPCYEARQPAICTWEFMDQDNLRRFMLLQDKSEVKKSIDLNIGTVHPKGQARLIFVELMYNIRKFCKVRGFNLEKAGATLSQFYLTHLFFTSKLDMSSEKIYIYFKDLMMCHSLPFPPHSLKIFSNQETKDVMQLFCKLYLRNLPLVRFLSLPNFAFQINYELEPEPVLTKPKKQKNVKEDKKEEKKESKKGSKKASKK